jgi:ornithine cyclodeaminase
VIVLSEEQVRNLASGSLVFKAVTRALIAAADGSGSLNPVVIGKGLNDQEHFSVKSGVARSERVVGLKVGSYWPGNSAANLRRHSSSILLLNPDSGQLMAVVEASLLNGSRTAAADAVAADVLARGDACTLTLFGAGNQAACEARALCSIRPITRVLIVSRNSTRAGALRDLLSSEREADIQVVEAEYGCREADILVTVTPSRQPLFDSKWLRPGTHIASMGSDQRGKQELPRDLLLRARLFCDLPDQSLSIGEFQHVKAEVEAGLIPLTAIGDVLAGRAKGRCNPDELTVFDSSGLALQDLYVADAILKASAHTGGGAQVNTDRLKE